LGFFFFFYLFFGFSIDVNSFSTSAGETFLNRRKGDLLFSFFTHIPPLSVSLSELASKVTGNKQANHRPRNNTIRVTVQNRTTTASAATYETSTEPAPNPKPPTTTTTTHTKTKKPSATTTTTSRQQQEQFQAEIDYEQTASSSLFDLSLVEYSRPKVVDRNNFGHFAPGESSSSPSSSSSGRQGTPETRMCFLVVDQLVVLLFILIFSPPLLSLLSAEIRWSGN
jgi:cobalamin biosynthesis Mg chelatase CobN